VRAPNVLRVRTGFTLIELLTVVMIIGILSTIATVKYNMTKQRAYVTAMKADLRNFAMTAESRFAMDGSYDNVVVPEGSENVTVSVMLGATDWTATATHANAPGVVCTMSVGAAADGHGQNEPVCH